MTPLIVAHQLKKHFRVKTGAFGAVRELKAVDGVDFHIGPGETLGVAGESGCGKSTVARLLMGLLPPDGGSVAYGGRPVAEMTRGELADYRRHVQMVFQDPFSSLNPRMRVGEIIGEPLAIHRVARGDALRQRVVQLMERVGLPAEQYVRYPHEFSGGQRQRIGIARALAVNPKVIVADEPVSALDLSIQAQIINLMKDLQEELGLSYLFISHDLSVIRYMSDRVAIMYLGKIVEIGDAEEVFRHYQHPYTEALLSAAPSVGAAAPKKRVILTGDLPSPVSPPSGCPFHTRCPYAKSPECIEIVPLLEEKKPAHLAACHFSRKLF